MHKPAISLSAIAPAAFLLAMLLSIHAQTVSKKPLFMASPPPASMHRLSDNFAIQTGVASLIDQGEERSQEGDFQTSEANKLVDIANAAIRAANEKVVRASSKMGEMDAAIPKIEDEKTLNEWRATAKEIIADLEKAGDGYQLASSRFEEASKLKLKSQFADYLSLKAKEMKKRSEMLATLIGKPQALIDSKSPAEYEKKEAKVLAKVESLQKEADALEAKANQIHEENKAMFKSN